MIVGQSSWWFDYHIQCWFPGNTALHWAARAGHMDIISALLAVPQVAFFRCDCQCFLLSNSETPCSSAGRFFKTKSMRVLNSEIALYYLPSVQLENLKSNIKLRDPLGDEFLMKRIGFPAFNANCRESLVRTFRKKTPIRVRRSGSDGYPLPYPTRTFFLLPVPYPEIFQKIQGSG